MTSFNKNKLFKEENIQNLDLNHAYDLFNQEYLQSTGKSWSKDKFFIRAKNWEFWGDENGFVATRNQKSGFVKLVGAAGSDKSKYKGFKELYQNNLPVWGMVDNKISSILKKVGFRGPNIAEQVVFKRLLKSGKMNATLGDAKLKSINGDKITLIYSDIGTVEKYFMGSPQYWKKLHWGFLNKESFEFDKTYNQLLQEYSLINEKIYGKVGWVYHRTRENPEHYTIHTKGIDASKNNSSAYGRGLYATYSLESQLNHHMRSTYGEYIVKGKINLSNFLILDKFVYYKHDPTGDFEEYLKKEGLDQNDISQLLNDKYTSDIAAEIWSKFYDKKDGIVFTGRTDGHVSVVWNPKSFIANSYSENDGKSWKPLNPDIKGIKSATDDRSEKSDINTALKKIIKNKKNVPDEIIKSISSNPLDAYNYAKDVFKGQNVPDVIIKGIASNPEYAYTYAKDVLKWQNVPDEIIKGISSDPHRAYTYAKDVLKWQNVPDVIIKSITSKPGYAYKYAKDVLKWQNVPDVIIKSISSDPDYAYNYVKYVLKWQNVPDEIIKRIASDPGYAYYYAKDGLKWQNVPDVIINSIASDPEYAYMYAGYALNWQNVPDVIIKGIASKAASAYKYAKDVLNWQNVPDVIMKSIALDSYYKSKIPEYTTLKESFNKVYYNILSRFD